MYEDYNNSYNSKDGSAPEPGKEDKVLSDLGQINKSSENQEPQEEYSSHAGQVNFTMQGSSYTSPNPQQSQSSAQKDIYPNQSRYTGSGTQSSYSSYNLNSTGNAAGGTGYSYYAEKPGKEKKKNPILKKAMLIVAGGLLFGGVAGGTMAGINFASNTLFPATHTAASKENTAGAGSSNSGDTKTVTTTSVSQAVVSDVSQVVEAAMPSVVSITNVFSQTVQDWFGQQRTYENEGSGSGIIVGKSDTELLIATNNHVIENATNLSVSFIDGENVTARVKGTDSDKDLAVIAVQLSDIKSDTLSKIAVAVLGDSDSLQVGEPAIAIGNSLGYGQSVTTGVISALNREVTVENVTNELIQTDAAINPGNSGGALLNIQGQVIGINAVKFASSEVEGMGYAIPISAAKPIIDELMNRTTRYKVAENESSYLGIAGVDVTKDVSATFNMPEGVYVGQVVEGGAAEAAGIRQGDIITKFDGSTVSTMDELADILQYYPAGTAVDVTVKYADNGEYVEKVISVTLGKKTEVSRE